MLPAYLPERVYPDSIPKPGSAARRLERPAGHFFVSDSPKYVTERGTPAGNRYARRGDQANRSGAKMIKYVQCLRRHPDLSPADFRQHWEEYKGLWQELADHLMAIRVSFSTTLAIDANEQIAELDLYLNDKLVDMSKPVTVVAVSAAGSQAVEQKKLYEGKASEKVTVKLRDAPDYSRYRGDPLWKQLVEIRKAAGR